MSTKEPKKDETSVRLSRTRRRKVIHGGATGWVKTEYFYSSGPNKGIKYSESNDAVPPRIDNTHYCRDTIKNPDYSVEKYGIPSDNGGELVSYHIDWSNDTGTSFMFSNPWYIKRSGYAVCVPGGFTHNGMNVVSADTPPSEDMSVSAYGPTLWASMKPVKPSVDLGVFIGEARDLPKLLYARLDGLKTISDVYLAAQFGWGSLLRDILNFLNFVEKFEKKIKYIIENAGKPIKRNAVISTGAPVIETLTVPTTYGSNWVRPLIGSYFFGGAPVASRYSNSATCTVEQRIWGEGLFVFWFNEGHIPTVPELTGKLLGLEITPKLVWELIPWSFLIDYFTNIGDIMRNLSVEVADNQVSLYAYAMKETKRTYKFMTTDGYVSPSVSRTFRTKARGKIHPFGLATNTTLTNRQAAILAALASKRT